MKRLHLIVLSCLSVFCKDASSFIQLPTSTSIWSTGSNVLIRWDPSLSPVQNSNISIELYAHSNPLYVIQKEVDVKLGQLWWLVSKNVTNTTVNQFMDSSSEKFYQLKFIILAGSKPKEILSKTFSIVSGNCGDVNCDDQLNNFNDTTSTGPTPAQIQQTFMDKSQFRYLIIIVVFVGLIGFIVALSSHCIQSSYGKSKKVDTSMFYSENPFNKSPSSSDSSHSSTLANDDLESQNENKVSEEEDTLNLPIRRPTLRRPPGIIPTLKQNPYSLKKNPKISKGSETLETILDVPESNEKENDSHDNETKNGILDNIVIPQQVGKEILVFNTHVNDSISPSSTSESVSPQTEIESKTLNKHEPILYSTAPVGLVQSVHGELFHLGANSYYGEPNDLQKMKSLKISEDGKLNINKKEKDVVCDSEKKEANVDEINNAFFKTLPGCKTDSKSPVIEDDSDDEPILSMMPIR